MQVVAYIIFTTTQLAIQITKLGVHPGFRRQGLGRKLLQVCIKTGLETCTPTQFQFEFTFDVCRSAYQLQRHKGAACSAPVYMLTAPMKLL